MRAQSKRQKTRRASSRPADLERNVRQLLADKLSGHLVGMWLLCAEHLRLGTWDLLCAWCGCSGERVEPRLALQLVHESALCTTGIRSDRTLTNRGGFELVNGLPFIASDTSIHYLLEKHTVEEALGLQIALGKIRRASGHFRGQVLAIDPHRVPSYSKRHMRLHAKKASEKPIKTAQTFWLLDVVTKQPICFSTSTSSRTVTQATPELLITAAEILGCSSSRPLVLADTEYLSAELLETVAKRGDFQMLVPMTHHAAVMKKLRAIPPEQFTQHWAGYATTKQIYQMARSSQPFHQFVQRNGELQTDWTYKAFLSTADTDELKSLTEEYPKRWHVEEFFNTDQALGWNRSGTQNLNIRFGQMTMALVAQAVLHELRCRIGEPVSDWDATHLSKDLLQGLDGDVRVEHDTIVVTYYNAPNAGLLAHHYGELPKKLATSGVNPSMPWLYGFKLDFRFR